MNTKTKILISAFTIPLVFLLFNILNPDWQFFQNYRALLVSIVLGIAEVALIAWVVDYRLKGERIFMVLSVPGISIFIFSMFLEIVIKSIGVRDLDRIGGTGLSMLILLAVTYVLTANTNLLNLASIQNIPLGQAARAAHYIITLVNSYFAFVLIVLADLPIIFKVVMLVALVFTYTSVALWTITMSEKERLISSIGIMLLMLFVFLVLSLWPIDTFYFALFLVLVYYMALGVALEIRDIIPNWIWYEYTVIFGIIVLLLFMVAPWGINGTIF